jgi:hypothetical protein
VKQSQLKQKTPLKAKTGLKRGVGLSAARTKPKPTSTKKRVPLEKKTTRQLIPVADKFHSKYIRLRDSECTGDQWIGTCITCSKTGLVAYIDDKGDLRFTHGWDNGHFVSRGNYVVRFDEENVNLQCSFRCNKMRSGEYVKYKKALRNKYAVDTPERLEKLAEELPGPEYHFSKPELLEIIHDSKVRIEHIKENR